MIYEINEEDENLINQEEVVALPSSRNPKKRFHIFSGIKNVVI